jgi:uncharacterized protein (TIGR02145 family)/uncharacterized repeat protein (TIGR02059 family)
MEVILFLSSGIKKIPFLLKIFSKMTKSKKTVFIFFLLTGCFIISTCERKFEKVMNVSTGAITVITSNSARAGGQIIDLGEGATQYGHCYAKSPNPTVAALKTQLGVPVVTGDFTSNLKDLEPGTKYYVRAYLNDGKEPVYGTETSFYTVSASPPIVTTTAATSVTNTTATLNGTVNANNLSTTVTFEYGLTISYGSTADATPNLVTSDTSTSVSASLTGLSEGTLYHYTVKAVSTGGTVYGSDLTFTTNLNPLNPAYVSSVIQNATPGVVEMTYNSTLANIVPATSAFTVMVNSVSRTINTVTISGTKVMLTLSSAVVFGDIVTVSYTKPASNPLQTTSGGQAVSISAQAVTNNVASVILIPVYVSSAVQNATPGVVEMTYNSTLANIVPATSAFTVMVNSVSRTVNSITISGTEVMLTLANPIVSGDIVTVAYTKPASNPLQTSSGGQAASISAQTVTNNTLCATPSATTSAATSLANTTATLNGTANANGCSTTVTFDYGLTTSYGSTVTAGQSPLTGSGSTAVSAIVNGLTSGQTYHFRVKASSSGGQTNGSDITFTTTIKDNDANVYTAVTIGTQVWMIENLKTTKYNDGTSINNVTDSTAWAALTTPAYCWYNNDAATYKATYGALYNWYAVNTGKLCPAGWHVPSDAEWTILTDYLGGESVAGGKMKESGTAHWWDPNISATNESGFTGLPGGYRWKVFYTGLIDNNISVEGLWWSSTLYTDPAYSWMRGLGHLNSSIYRNGQGLQSGLSVRCVKN